ncbi:MAG TPA: response regulator transcription factor [Bacteroidota bacterium]|nr:response regulator transcription factor [Bacteroidota bacterium]
MKTILIIEDDSAIRKGLQEMLGQEHFHVLAAGTGEQGLSFAKHDTVDLVILDLGLPDMNGEEVCKQLRSSGATSPILMLTSKSQEMDKVLGLEIGADDYVTKPFSVRELLARIRALLRRKGTLRQEVEDVTFGNVHVDFIKQETTRKGKVVKLTVREYAVLRFLALHEGEVVTRDMLLNQVWGYETFPTTRTVDNYVLSLRKKLEADPASPQHILTIHTAGYKFVRS